MNSTPTTVAPIVPLESVVCTEELNRRPARPPNYETENRRLISLAQALADSPGTILQILVDTILEVLQAGSTGISLVTEDQKRFHWPAIAGGWKSYIGSGTPRDFGPCGDVLDRNGPLLFSQPQRRYPYFLSVTPPAEECLLVPFYVAGKAVGTLWAIAHDERRKFDSEDLRMLVSLGTFASAAYQALEKVRTLSKQDHEHQASQAMREMNEALLLSSVRQHELTEQSQQAEAAAHESEARFRALVMASSDVVYRMSPDWSEMCQLDGRNFIADMEQPSRTWLQEYIHPDDQPVVLAGIKEAVRTKTIFELEHRVRRVDGTLGWTFSRAVPLLDPQGEIVEWFGTASDVTERKRAEETIRESEERYRNLFNSMDEGYCIIEVIFDECEQPVDYCFLEVNPSFEKQSGLHDATGKRMRELHPDHEEHWFDIYGKVALTGEPVRFVNEAKALDGRWFDVYAFRVGGRDSRKVAVLFNDITRRRESEEALRQRAVELAEAQRETLETLALVDALISNAPIGMAYYDPDLRFVRLNQALADINGLPLESHLRRTIPELLPGIPKEALDQFRQVLATGQPILNYEVCGETPKAPGELRWWLVNYYPVQVQTDKVHTKDTLGVGVAVLEITQQKRAEVALRESEHRLRFVLDSMPQKIFTARPNGEIDYFNPQWTEFTGLSDKQLKDSGWTKLVHLDDLDEKARQWRHAFDTGEPFQSEHRFRRADGEYRWHFSRAVPMRDETGRITMWVGSNTDVHDIKQAERALLDSEVRYRRLFEVSHDGILILDAPSGTILDANPFMSELLGYSRDEFLGKELWEIGLFHDKSASEVAVRELQEKSDIRYEYLPLETIRGRKIEVEVVANVYQEDHHTVIQCNIRDITERSLLQRKLSEQALALTDLHRRKDEFLAMLSHELRNPLAPISNAVHLLRLQNNEDPLQQQARAIIERQVGQLVRLVDDLLEISRINTGRISLHEDRVTLNGIAENAVETVRPLIRQHRHSLETSLPPQPIWLYGDAARLEQVVVNLLTNAAKYMDEGGHIWLTVAQEGDQAVLRVRDTGVGIAPELLPRIFDLFTQADRSLDRSQGGLGVGLSLVQRLLEMHRGTVEVYSEVGLGSEFVVRLPVVLSPAPLPASPSEQTTPTGSSLRVLAVDDNVDVTTTLAMLLEVSGHHVRTAHDGPSALEAALDFRPNVVLLDIGLPRMNGFEVARKIRQQLVLKDVVLVAMTGYGQESDRRRSMEAGFDHHLVKPVDFHNLQQMLARLAENVR